MSKTAMKLALEALEICSVRQEHQWQGLQKMQMAEHALREALAEQKSGIKQVIELYDSPEQPAQQGAKIVRWNCPCGNKYTFHGFTKAPAQRKPLTDEQLLHFVDIHVGAPSMAYPLDNSDWITFARAIEAAHGIKE